MRIITIIAVCYLAIGVAFCWSFTSAVPQEELVEQDFEYLSTRAKRVIYNLFALFVLFFWFLFLPSFLGSLRNKNTP